MQINPPPYLAAAIAACATLSMTGANALTLGNLVVRSHLGEPLHAQIAVRTSTDESIDETCITLHRPANAPEDIPYLSRSRFSVAHAPSGQVIRIRSTQIINDPILKVLLQVSCSGQASLSREFTVLLEPANYTSAAPLAEDETPQRKQVEDKSAPQPGTPWEIRPGDTLADIARAVYPNSPAQQHRLEQAIAAANPNIFGGDIKGDLPVGQALNIPELPAIKRASSQSKRSTAIPASQSAGYDVPKKRTRQHPATTEIFQLKLSTGEIDLSASRNMTKEDRLKLREKQLLLEADDQVANIMALKNQVKQLESRLSELSLKMSTGMPNATPSPTPQIVHKTMLPAQPPAKPLPASGLNNFWFGLGLIGVLLGLFFTMRRYRRHNRALEQFALDEHYTMEDEKTKSAWVTPKPIPAVAKSTAEETYYDPSSIFTPPDEKITLTEMDSVVEEADLYLIYGWTDKAVDLLQGYIEKHPQEIQPWIMLFDIYRSQGKKEAFDKLAHRFKENIDDEEQWHKVQALGHEFDPKNSLYFSAKQKSEEVKTQEADNHPASKNHQAAQKPEDDFWAHSKTDSKPKLKK